MPEQKSDLPLIREHLWLIADDPGPLVANGSVVTDRAGKPVPDVHLKLRALELLAQVNREIARSAGVIGRQITLEDIRVTVESARDAIRRAQEEAGDDD